MDGGGKFDKQNDSVGQDVEFNVPCLNAFENLFLQQHNRGNGIIINGNN